MVELKRHLSTVRYVKYTASIDVWCVNSKAATSVFVLAFDTPISKPADDCTAYTGKEAIDNTSSDPMTMYTTLAVMVLNNNVDSTSVHIALLTGEYMHAHNWPSRERDWPTSVVCVGIQKNVRKADAWYLSLHIVAIASCVEKRSKIAYDSDKIISKLCFNQPCITRNERTSLHG